MKKISLYTLSIGLIMFTMSANAHTGAFSAHNIGTYQHSIINNARNEFQKSVSARLDTPIKQYDKRPAHEIYGKMSEYGTMPMYGEFGDDTGTITLGHAGGDIAGGTLSDMWLNLSHYNEYSHMNNAPRTSVDYTISMLGTSGYMSKNTQIGVFGGYIDGNIDEIHTPTNQNAFYLGGFSTYTSGHFNIYAALTGGAAFSHPTPGDDNYTNWWLGINSGASYDIALDNATALVPGLDFGYTWVSAHNFTSGDGLHLFEIAPGVHMLRHIWNGWYGTIGAKYVFNFSGNGHSEYNHTPSPEFDPRDFSEYGISIEHPMGPMNLNIFLNRRDGGRTGWNGGAKIRYIF